MGGHWFLQQKKRATSSRISPNLSSLLNDLFGFFFFFLPLEGYLVFLYPCILLSYFGRIIGSVGHGYGPHQLSCRGNPGKTPV